MWKNKKETNGPFCHENMLHLKKIKLNKIDNALKLTKIIKILGNKLKNNFEREQTTHNNLGSADQNAKFN